MLVFWKILQNVLNEWSLKGFVRTSDPNALKNFGETLLKIFHLIYIEGKNFHERTLYHLAIIYLNRQNLHPRCIWLGTIPEKFQFWGCESFFPKK